MTLVDHLYVLALVLPLPIAGYISYRRVVARANAGEDVSRPGMYLQTQALEWAMFAAVVGLWLYLERPFSELGFVAPGGTGFFVSAAACTALLAFSIYYIPKTRHMTNAERRRQAENFGDLVHFLPQNDRDLRHFMALSVTAGIVEEIVYRGFLFWYFGAYLPVWAVILASSVVFGIAHSYQGLGGMLRVFLLGIPFALLYYFSGSLWLPIVAHALIDILQGLMISEILGRRAPEADGDTAAADA